jgi:hypothetical protein
MVRQGKFDQSELWSAADMFGYNYGPFVPILEAIECAAEKIIDFLVAHPDEPIPVHRINIYG